MTSHYFQGAVKCYLLITPHACMREQGDYVIGAGVHLYMYVCDPPKKPQKFEWLL